MMKNIALKIVPAILVACFLLVSSGTSPSYETFDTITSFPLNDRNVTTDHWLVYPAEGKCPAIVEEQWTNLGGEVRKLVRVKGELSKSFFDNDKSRAAISSSPDGCPVICLNMGTPVGSIVKPPEYLVYSGKRDSTKFAKYDHAAEDYEDSDDFKVEFSLSDWINEACQRVENGWVSYHPNDVGMFWVRKDGTERSLGNLQYGEKKTIWQTTTLGHRFRMKDSVSNDILDDVIITREGFQIIGHSESKVGQNRTDPTIDIKRTLDREWDRANRITRTFTELGFSVGRVPDDLWTSIVSYYNNNANSFAREEWENKGVHVNWWEVDAFMIGMPWRLKRYWQTRLIRLVETWSGVSLENTDIYGMRRYESGARLLTHVDRHETHAASMIINIAQRGVSTPWAIEIYDFAGRLHEIMMEPGDIVYYESARCLHGRMAPLDGGYYVNLFTHYRPTGDPNWWSKPNPQGTAEQLIDVGACTVSDQDSSKTSCAKIDLESLSPKLETLRGSHDLFEYWKKTSPNSSGHSSLLSEEL